MRNIYYAITAAAMLFALCGNSEKAPAEYAEQYYNCLIAGNAEQFAEGIYSYSHLAPALRKEKVIIAKQYIKSQEKVNEGIKEVQILNDTILPSGNDADVYLSLTFGNGKKETVLVPMIKDGEEWKMK